MARMAGRSAALAGRMARMRRPQLLEEEGGGGEPAVGRVGIAGDGADRGPAAAPVEPVAGAALLRVEGEQGPAMGEREGLRRLEQAPAGAPSASRGMDDHLADIGAVRLV